MVSGAATTDVAGMMGDESVCRRVRRTALGDVDRVRQEVDDTLEDSRAPRTLPGRLTISLPLRTPAKPRESAIAGFEGAAYDNQCFWTTGAFWAEATVKVYGIAYHIEYATKAKNDPFDRTDFQTSMLEKRMGGVSARTVANVGAAELTAGAAGRFR